MLVHKRGPLDINLIFEELEQFAPVKIEYKYLDRGHSLKEIDVT